MQQRGPRHNHTKFGTTEFDFRLVVRVEIIFHELISFPKIPVYRVIKWFADVRFWRIS